MNYESFLDNTIDFDLFKINNVEGDNKCFYRSVILSLLFNSDLKHLKEPYNMVLKKTFRTYNIIQDFEAIKFDQEYRDRAIYNLENRVISWISKNRHNTDNPVGLSMTDIIQMTHNIDIDSYIKRDYDEFPIWGGLPEQIAVANIYKTPIYIFRSVRFNKKKNRIGEGIILGEKPNKDSRLQLVQQINPNQSINRPIYLLWKHYSNGDDHYMALLPKGQFENINLGY